MKRVHFRMLCSVLCSLGIFCLMGARVQASPGEILAPEDAPVQLSPGESIVQAQLAGQIITTDTSIVYKMLPVYATRRAADKNQYGNSNNGYGELKIPTQIIKTGGYYFLVDCYHDQVLYTQNLGCPLKEWKVLTNQAKQPHTIASDGTVYLVDDTENNRVLVFERVNGRFQNTQVFPEIGKRPHYIVYDGETDCFFTWSSLTGDMYVMKREPVSNTVYISEIRHINELSGIYVRSFTIAGDTIIFPSGNNCYVTVADKNTLEVLARYPVTEEISGMAQICPIGNYYYITVSTDLNYNQNSATIIRTSDLTGLAYGQYEDIYHLFQTEGTPYYISGIDGMYYMTNHRSKKGVWRFAVEDDRVKNVGAVY